MHYHQGYYETPKNSLRLSGLLFVAYVINISKFSSAKKGEGKLSAMNRFSQRKKDGIGTGGFWKEQRETYGCGGDSDGGDCPAPAWSHILLSVCKFE